MSIRYFSPLFLLTLILLPSLFASAQEKCGTPVYNKILEKRNPALADQEEFEQWLKEKTGKKTDKAAIGLRSQQFVYKLPVVVHVIHNGEAVGVGKNISNEQILRQIQILNTDYRKLNTAEINALPPEFQKVAADTQIEFVLARQDPEGLPTNGITRTLAPNNKQSYSMDEDLELKTLIHWPPQDYINIYVVDITPNPRGDVLGYSQFPETDKLQGLDLGKVSAETDGVVIDYKYFGVGEAASSLSKGRTLTHELGHFLGLRHLWGDGDCNVDDFVQDTPFSSSSYDGFSNCTATPSSCGTPDMFQNFLTYANDACMALFTAGQRDRIHVVLQNSPRRKELINSHALEPPTIVANDAGILQFTIAITDPCTKSFIPTLTIRNYGNTRITRVEVGIFINGVKVERAEIIGLELDYLEGFTQALNEIAVLAKGGLLVEARILSVNSTTDPKMFNNSLRTDLFVPYVLNPPVLQDFEIALSPFYRINPDFFLTWQVTDAPITGDADNRAVYMNFYDYDINIGAKDLLISPILNLEDAQEAYLSFRVAYAQYQPDSEDGLAIYLTTDCSESIENAQLIFSKTGDELATAPPTDDPFVPSGNENWRTEQIDLSPFLGQENFQIIFVGINDYGNNLYIDNIEINTEPRKQLDAALQSIKNPSIVSCINEPLPAINIRNAGLEVIESLDLLYSIDSEAPKKVSYAGLALGSQESIQLEIPELPNLKEGKHTIRARITSVNGQFDENPANDFQEKNFVIDDATDVIPLRQEFLFPDPLNDWISVSPSPQTEGWVFKSVTGSGMRNNMAATSEFFETKKGTENWLVSPILDLSELELAGVQFRHSYAALSTASDILQVRVSADCGRTWSNILYEKRGNELSNRTVNTRWSPHSYSDWDTSFVDLSSFAGLPEVRVAFVAISDGGNNIYLDDIEFFESNLPITAVVPEVNSMYVFPNPTTGDDLRMIFNLESRQDVQLSIYDSRGSLKLQRMLPNTLNQVYFFDLQTWAPGVYYVHAQSKTLSESSRFILLK